MKNIFELNESQKNNIRNLHNSKKTSYGTSLIKEDDLQTRGYDVDYIGSEEMEKLELEMGASDVAEEIFKLFDHKIAEWVSNPDIRVTKETNVLMTEWKDNAKNQIVRLLNNQHKKDFKGKGYGIPGFEDTMDDLDNLNIRS
jgi:hypothetical protein|tara:strand:- start:26856 stop:27281 length:426 start_codon:yes stop_codon:yes gene_type:complete